MKRRIIRKISALILAFCLVAAAAAANRVFALPNRPENITAGCSQHFCASLAENI